MIINKTKLTHCKSSYYTNKKQALMFQGYVSLKATLLLTACLSFSTLAAETTLFEDGFESGDLVAGGWVQGPNGGVNIVSSAAYGGSDYGARVKRGATITKTVNTSGYAEINVSYARATESLTQAGEDLVVDWSYDGSTWNNFETTQDTAWAEKSYSVASDVNNQFHLRFWVTANKNTERGYLDDIKITASAPEPIINPNVNTVNWSYNSSGAASLVATAQVSGSYAVADGANNEIELRDIREQLLHTITASDIQTALTSENISSNHNICSIALTPSGRQVFIGICVDGSNDDVILAFNTNTEVLSVFDLLTIDSSASSDNNYAMAHFKGQLFVGTDNGLFHYDASKNSVADNNDDQPLTSPLIPVDSSTITGLAVDMVDQKLYLSTTNNLYRIDLTSTLSLENIASGSNIKAITFARTYGGDTTGGLYLLENDNAFASLSFVDNSSLRAGGSVTLNHYTDFDNDLSDIAATAEGRILLATDVPQMMSDSTDTRMDFDTWLADELAQYVNSIKSLVGSGVIPGTNPLVPEGFLTRKIVAATENPNDTPIADNVGWALYLLMAADQVNPDADIETIMDLLIQRHAGLHSDTLGGVKTVDGHFMRNYVAEGFPNETNPQPQVYISMKFLPAVYKAAELYPDNANFQAYKEYLRQTFKRGSDTIRAEQRITWEVDEHGPVLNNNKMTNETWIYGDLAAAQDPLATKDYAQYVYSRKNMNYNEWLIGEPVILPSHSAFIIMGGSMILRHHFEDADWSEQNKNYYGVTMAAGDDLGAPYYAAFSAGNNPYATGSSYYNDGPSDHPGDMIHFPAVLGLGQLGWTAPVVGGYMAYRDGLRQEILNGSAGANFSMLTRWTANNPSYVMPSVGIADFWYGAMGIMETIQPGIMDLLRDEFYLPQMHEATSSDGNVELHFSKITPRRVIGIDAFGNETSYGFQLSPFEFAPNESYESYKVVDPEGELLELNEVLASNAVFQNPDFENSLTGWTQNGDYKFYKPNINGISIVGTSAEIRTNPNVTDDEASLSQSLSVALDLENTRYKIRANGFLATSGAPGKGYLRVQWDNDNDASNGVTSTQSSNLLDVNNPRVEFLIDAHKPANANYLHISFVVETVTPAYHRYIFDNLSVVRLGADAPISNGDFENGITGWSESASQINLTTDPTEVITGNSSLKFAIGAGLTGWKKATTNFDVSNDPLGTRYIFRLDTKIISMTDSNFEIMIETYDANGDLIITRNDVGDITEDTDGEIAFTFRRRPDESYYVITFRMKRNSSASIGTDEVIIDNFRVDKEQLF